MAPPVPLANVDTAPAATTTTMAPSASSTPAMTGPSPMDARVSDVPVTSAFEAQAQKPTAALVRARAAAPATTAAPQAPQAASVRGSAKKSAPVCRAATSMSGGGNVRSQAAAPRKHKATAAPEGAQIAAKRRRKVYTSREETKQRATAAMHLIVKSSHMQEISVVPAWRLPELGVNCGDDQKGSDGVLLAFGQNPEGLKAMICSAINAILNAADDGERSALKWDTLQRDIQWKYQRRMKGGSIYLYESFSQVVETSNVLTAEIAPTTVDQLLVQLIQREQAEWDFVGATVDKRPHASGGGANFAAAAPVAAVSSQLARVAPGKRPAVASASNKASAPPAARGGGRPQRQESTSAGVGSGGQDSAQNQRKCSWRGCSYSCSTKGHLVRHMRVHTGEKSQYTHTLCSVNAHTGVQTVASSSMQSDDSSAHWLQASVHIGACGQDAITRPHSQATLRRIRKSIKMIEELRNCNSTSFGERFKRRATPMAHAMPLAAETCECNACSAAQSVCITYADACTRAQAVLFSSTNCLTIILSKSKTKGTPALDFV
jgi:hypothetical protein